MVTYAEWINKNHLQRRGQEPGELVVEDRGPSSTSVMDSAGKPNSFYCEYICETDNMFCRVGKKLQVELS